MAKLTEEQTKVRNANKAKNLIGQVDHLKASSNINSIGCIERYEDGMYRFCKWLGENTELKNLKNVSAKYIYPYVESFFDRECKTSYIRTEMSAIRHYHSLTHSKNILPSNKDYLTSFKKTTNPNVSPIGKRFGFECFGADVHNGLKWNFANCSSKEQLGMVL